MSEFKAGSLKSGSGKKVTNRKQAIAIGINQSRKKDADGDYDAPPSGGSFTRKMQPAEMKAAKKLGNKPF